jgi:hypothetical protein
MARRRLWKAHTSMWVIGLGSDNGSCDQF